MVTPPGAPPALTLVAQRFAATSHGIVRFHLHRVFDVHAGSSKRHEDLVMDGIYSDGATVKVHVSSYTIDGKPADAATLATLEQSWEHPAPGAVFNVPFDPRYVDGVPISERGAAEDCRLHRACAMPPTATAASRSTAAATC